MAKRQRAARGLRAVSIETLENEIRYRRRSLAGLQRRYVQATRRAERLARQIGSLGGSLKGRAIGARSRPRNKQSLMGCLRTVLDGKQMEIGAIIDAVHTSGYRSSSGDFRSMVTKALSRSGRFKRVSRGVYTAK